MSSIIDALKKSDKNRTNESGANIDQIKFGNEPPPKSRRGFWLLVILLLLVAGGVFAWSQGWHHIAIAETKNFLGLDPTKSVFASKTETKPDAVTQISKQKNTEEKSKRNNKLTPPKPNEVKAKSIAAEQEKIAIENKRRQQVEANALRGSEKATGSDDTKTNALKIDEIEPVKSNKPTAQVDVNDAIRESELKAKQNRQDLEPTMKQDYLLVHQIDFELRKNIPPLKLNVHIYDPEPENRMVILNGVKYVTGDSIEELVSVEEINQSGVVLKFENTQFLIPK